MAIAPTVDEQSTPTKAAAKAARQAKSRETRQQFFQAFKMQRKEDKWLIPLMILAFVVAFVLVGGSGFLVGGILLYISLALGLGIGVLAAMIVFGRRVQKSVYKKADGRGHVRCDNGQSANVLIHVRGGGLTAGKFSIENGKGEFTNVKGLHEVYGEYANAGANAGAVKSAESSVMTKGEVSLAITGTGRGFNLGVDLSKFEIEPLK